MSIENPSQKIVSNGKPLHKHAEISIWLDSYDDLFSDFDPRPYLERTLSDDFLLEAKKVAKEHAGRSVTLRLLMPETQRKPEEEKMIMKRLHAHFSSIHEQLHKEKKKTFLKGIVFSTIGVLLMVAASYISFIKPEKYYIHLLLILFEPSGWFMLWMGLDNLFYFSKTTRRDLEFYSRMSGAKIEFAAY